MIPVRDELSLDELRQEARRLASLSDEGMVVLKLLGLALILEGAQREEAARLVGLGPRSLADAVKRYNAEGIEGLWDRGDGGRPSKLSPEQDAELRQLVLAGPGQPESDCLEFNLDRIRDLVEQKWGIRLDPETVRRKLHAMGLVKLVCRPIHHKTDKAAQEKFKADFPARVAKVAQDHPEARSIEVWVQDETRVGQKSKLGRRWVEKGSSPTTAVHGGFKSAWLFGAFCPQRDIGVAIVVEAVSTEAMSVHLAAVSKAVLPDNHAMVLVDGAGFHATAKDLVVPTNITIVTLPPYSPELSPPEAVWEFLKNGPLLHRLYNTVDDVIDRCCAAWNSLVGEPGRIRSLCSFPWLMTPSPSNR